MLPRSKKRNSHTLSCFLGQFNLIWVCWQYRFTAFERFNINRPCRRCHVYICSYYRSAAEYDRSKRVLLFSSFTRTFGQLPSQGALLITGLIELLNFHGLLVVNSYLVKTSQFVLTGLKCIILRQVIERIQLLFCLVLNYYRFTLVYIRWITYNISIYEVCTLLCIEMVIYKLFSVEQLAINLQ